MANLLFFSLQACIVAGDVDGFIKEGGQQLSGGENELGNFRWILTESLHHSPFHYNVSYLRGDSVLGQGILYDKT